ncbi:MAG: SMP-30/gluconolactonase/LRE family protein [Chitinophagaceae bacterium]
MKYMICILSATVLLSVYTIAQTPRISFEAPAEYPEGLAYDPAADIFFVSSVKTGTIGKVNSQGQYTVFYRDSTLKSSYGMKVDSARHKLWVCTGDPNYSRYSDSSTYKKIIRIISLDTRTGAKLNDIDLSGLYNGLHFANDMTLDNQGNLYITDSYSPVVYRIDANGKAGVFAQSDWFKAVDIGLNGIVWSPDGYLIVAHNSDGNLYKIDISDPRRITRIKQQTFFPGADGLLWDGQGNLVLVQNKGVHKIFRLSSKDNWQSAEVTAGTLAADRFHQPSTATLRKNTIYVMNSKLNELSDPTAAPSKEFSLQQVRFQPSR